ncbi:MAG: quinone-dependent dihydroorotate dehydrogenase [Verrucomicrobiota bacterium]
MFYQKLVKPILFRFDPESVHHAAMDFLQNPFFASLASLGCSYQNPQLKKNLWGIDFPNPVGLAAGFDKNALALPVWEKFGFGFVEIGTVTAHGQEGNPRPRIFRIPEAEAVINRMGFPNEGAIAISERLEVYKHAGQWPRIPVGINLGKSKITSLEEAPLDYLESFKRLRDFADYIAINVSSPNTPGLRSLQTKESLLRIVEPIQEANSKQLPILIKIAPDLTWDEIEAVLEAIETLKCQGIIATNTTLDKSSVALKEEGGLSGRPVKNRSTEIVRWISKKTENKLPIIGVGGIQFAEDAREKLEVGASLVQIYTGFIYQGPRSVKKILKRI